MVKLWKKWKKLIRL